MKDSTRHTFTLIGIALCLLLVASAIPWSKLTGNSIKDFNLLGDLFPRPERAVASTSQITDPELENLLNNFEEDSDSLDLEDENLTPSDTTDSITPVPLLSEAPVVDGHVVIESYTGSEPLARFREALAHASECPVRIAIVGDSFIEGDIFVQDLREFFQQKYGGSGVGYINIFSEMPGFRKSVRQSGSGWQMHNIQNITRNDSLRILAGEYGYAEAGAKATYRGTKYGTGTKSWEKTSVEVLATDSCTLTITIDSLKQDFAIAPSSTPRIYSLTGFTTSAKIEASPNLCCMGVYLDGNTGVSIDCMSNRGSAGLNLARLNPNMKGERTYDLIILEFGINALNAEESDYSHYHHAMVKSVERVKRLYPEADIVVMGIADRGAKIDGAVRSLPTCNAMTNAQRQVAFDTHTHFYDLRAAQGGENAIVEWRERNLVNADYIHLNHAGGKEMAREFFDGLMITLSAQ